MPQELVITTPENAEIRVPLAGMFSRAGAFFHDLCLQILGLLFIEFIMISALGSIRQMMAYSSFDLLLGLNMIIVFLWIFGYYTFFEVLRNGHTPGKKAFRIRVINCNGQRIRIFGSLLRNFLRIADFFPILFVTAMVSILLSDQHQRIGDIFAGTVVIRDDP